MKLFTFLLACALIVGCSSSEQDHSPILDSDARFSYVFPNYKKAMNPLGLTKVVEKKKTKKKKKLRPARTMVGHIIHKVRQGETFGHLSQRYYGRYKYWKTIWRNNKTKYPKPRKLKVGTLIYIPKKFGENQVVEVALTSK